MLKKENKQLIKSLTGEYKKFAKSVTGAVFSHCVGNDAINETLNDLFVLLADAQATGQAFCNVIPDRETTIRETIGCLTPRKLRRGMTAVAIAAVAVLCACAGVIYEFCFSPVRLNAVQHTYYDGAQNALVWEAVEHAAGYELYLNGEALCETEKTAVTLPDGTFDGSDCIEFAVIAKGKGRYRDSVSVRNTLRVELPEVSGGIADFIYQTQPSESNGAFLKLKTARRGVSPLCKLTLIPEYHFFGALANAEDVQYATQNGSALDLTSLLLFRADSAYTFYVNAEKAEALLISLFSLADLPENAEILSGKTLFNLDYQYRFNSVYGATERCIDFRYVQKNSDGFVEGNHTNAVYPCYDGGYASEPYFILTENLNQESSAPLVLREDANALGTPNAGRDGEFYFRTGYTAVKISENALPPEPDYGVADNDVDPAYRSNGLALALYIHGDFSYVLPDGNNVEARLNRSTNFTLFQAAWENDHPRTFLFYAKDPTLVKWECFDANDESNIIRLGEDTTEMTLRPGLNVLQPPETSGNAPLIWDLSAQGSFGRVGYAASVSQSPICFSDRDLAKRLVVGEYYDTYIDTVYPELDDYLKAILQEYFNTINVSNRYNLFNPSNNDLAVAVKLLA